MSWQELASKLADLTQENRKMKAELDEFRAESSHLKNQQATVRRLEERNRQLEQLVRQTREPRPLPPNALLCHGFIPVNLRAVAKSCGHVSKCWWEGVSQPTRLLAGSRRCLEARARWLLSLPRSTCWLVLVIAMKHVLSGS